MVRDMIRKTLVVALMSYASAALAQPAPDAPPPADMPPPPPTTGEPMPPPPVPPTDEHPQTAVSVEKPAPEAPPEHGGEVKATPTMVKGKTELTFYGFVQMFGIYDSTQNLNEQMQTGTLQRPGTYAGNHGQTQESARHSRFGFKIAHPVTNDIKASAQFEMDFLGNQPGNPATSTAAAGQSEGGFYQNGTMRFRHVFAKFETPVVDVIAGQTWSLFGFQSTFHPNSVEIQGLPGQVYKRTAQFRLGKTIKSDAVDVDIAIAAQRPPQRDSATPDGVAAIKATFNSWKGWHTKGANDSGLDGLTIGASVIGRRFALDEFSAAPSKQVTTNGYGLSVDALIPVIPATKKSHEGALTLTGSFVTGAGIADQYDGLNFNVSNPALPTPMGATAAPTYFPNIDAGLVQYYVPAGGTAELHAVQVTSFMGGLQYYLPVADGKVWISANYTHTQSDNSKYFGAKAWTKDQYIDANLFADLTHMWRIGFAYSNNKQTFQAADTTPDKGFDATNHRVLITSLLLF